MGNMYVWLSGATLITIVSFGWLALAMNKHWRQVFNTDGPSERIKTVLRLLACLGLLVSFYICLLANHASIAALVWIMLLTGASIVIGMLLTWKPSVLKVIFPK